MTAVLLALPGLSPVRSAAQAQTVEQVLLHPRDQDPLVAVAVRFPEGAERDPNGQAGAVFVLGRVIEEEGNRRLAELSSRVEVDVGTSEVLVTLVAPPEHWGAAWERIRDLLAGTDLPEDAVIRARERHAERLLFESGAPGRLFEIEKARFLLGAGHPAARPVAGSRDAIDRLDRASLESVRSASLRWSDAVVAVVGAFETTEVRRVFSGPERTVGPPPAVPPPAPPAPDPPVGAADTLPVAPPTPAGPRVVMEERSPPLQAPPPAPASYPWASGGREVMDQDVTSTWIMVAWPLPPGAPLVLQEFLVHLVSESLNPVPPDPGLYRADVEVRDLSGSPVLLVSASVDPRSAYAWEERILATLDDVTDSPPQGAFFELARRRYRSLRLLEHAVPEERARWVARSYASSGEVPRIPSQVWGLTRAAVSDLARARGEPQILLYGPRSVMDP